MKRTKEVFFMKPVHIQYCHTFSVACVDILSLPHFRSHVLILMKFLATYRCSKDSLLLINHWQLRLCSRTM